MKSRAEVAAFINAQLDGTLEKEGQPYSGIHYGRRDFRFLMDFIYGGEPQSDSEKINGGAWGHSDKSKPGEIRWR